MESNFGGFTDKGSQEFIATMKDLLAPPIVQLSTGGDVAIDVITSKSTCLVDEYDLPCVDNYSRLKLLIHNNGTTTAYVRKVYGNPTEDNATAIIASGFPIPVHATIDLGRFSGSLIATADSASMDLRVMQIVQTV